MSGSAPPLVSVVVPAHNAEGTLAQTLMSAMAQTYPHLEIVVVDDGSTDGTAGLVSRFTDGARVVRMVTSARPGAGAARNSGLAAANGEYVAFLDADDLWHPRKIEKQVAIAAEMGEFGFIYTYAGRIDGRDNPLSPMPQIPIDGFGFWRHLHWNFVGCGSVILARRDVLLAIGGFHEDVDGCEDYLLQLRLAAHYPIACIREVLLSYRDRPGSVSSDRESMLRAWRRAIVLLHEDGYPTDARIIRQTYSRAAWGLAIAALRQLHLGRAARHLLTAVRDDPLRTAYNAARVSARLIGLRTSAHDEQVIYGLDIARLGKLKVRDESGVGNASGLPAPAARQTRTVSGQLRPASARSRAADNPVHR